MGLFGSKEKRRDEVIRTSGCSDIQDAVNMADRYGVSFSDLPRDIVDWAADFVATSPDEVQSSSSIFRRKK